MYEEETQTQKRVRESTPCHRNSRTKKTSAELKTGHGVPLVPLDNTICQSHVPPNLPSPLDLSVKGSIKWHHLYALFTIREVPLKYFTSLLERLFLLYISYYILIYSMYHCTTWWRHLRHAHLFTLSLRCHEVRSDCWKILQLQPGLAGKKVMRRRRRRKKNGEGGGRGGGGENQMSPSRFWVPTLH